METHPLILDGAHQLRIFPDNRMWSGNPALMSIYVIKGISMPNIQVYSSGGFVDIVMKQFKSSIYIDLINGIPKTLISSY